jgi:hypothetical protein
LNQRSHDQRQGTPPAQQPPSTGGKPETGPHPPIGVESLGPSSHGRWLIHSRGTVHLLDLDARTYRRQPGPTSQSFPYDNQDLELSRVEVWPQVGGRMLLFFDDPEHPDLIEHYRVCSRIQSITSSPTAEKDAARSL